MTAQEALSAFFQTVADRFLDMAAQIISKWIEMTILNSALRLFPGGTLFTGAGPVSGAAAFSGAGIGSAGFSLPSLIPMRAAGGPVMAGSPYIVGEKGPELFVPGRSGGIVPNDSLGMGSANVVVNVDASGSNVQGDGNQANQLGKAIGIAVQQELIKQKRPGGLLA
jgi:phage-related minor tail protein